MEKFYQACFTRVGGTDRSSGWQLTNLSEDIPGKLLSTFEQRQQGNESVGRGMPRNRDREPLCALEIHCEADSIALTRIQYGVPCYGREGLFSQGFLFPNAYELLKEPNRLLSVADENFCFRGEIRPDSAEALQSYLNRTATPPAELIRGPGWTVDSALARTGMKRSYYKELICCLYGSWAKSARNAVWIKTDGTDEYVRAMLYLIYAALPYSMRPKVTASTFTDARNTSVIFTHELSDGCRYFDPANGMSNVLTPNQRKRWSRMPFVTMAFEDEAPRFDVLEEMLAQIGDRCSQDTNILQIAYRKGLGGADADPVEQLYEYLDTSLDYNETVERWVAEEVDAVASVITAQGAELSSDMEQLLDQRLEAAQTPELRNACRRFKIARLHTMKREDAVRKLLDSPQFFEEVREDLSQMDWGRSLLEDCYRQKIMPVVEDPAVSYKQLLERAEQFCDLQEMTELWELIFHGAKRRAEENAKAAVERKLSMAEGGHSPLYVVLEDYNHFAQRIEHNGRIPEAEQTQIDARMDQDVKSVTERWVREYDRCFRKRFDPERIAEYEQFYNKDFRTSSLLRYSTELLKIYLAAPKGMINVLLDFVKGGCLINTYHADGARIQNRTQLKPENASEKKLIEQSLYSYWVDTEAVQKNDWMQDEIRRLDEKASKKNRQDFKEKDTKSFLFWEQAAENQNMNPIWLMLEKGSVLLTDEVIMRSLAVNDCYWTDERLDSMISWCEECIRDGKAGAKGTLEILKTAREIHAKLMESNRKQAEKEAKRSGKKEKQNAKQEPEEGSEKPEMPAVPPKTEGPPKTAEPKYEVFNKPGTREQPGVPNKFTEDVDNIDAVLDILAQGHTAPTESVLPQVPENPAENFADPVEVEQEENKKGGFWSRWIERRRS